jgi:broad specificity phosphatase PhoE
MVNGLQPGRRQVIFLRPGQTASSANNRFTGNQDISLNGRGLAAADFAAKQLATLRPTTIITSDLKRATETAAALENRTGLQALKDGRLRPLSALSLEGLTASEIYERYPGEWRTWDEADSQARPPGGGESRWEVGYRASQSILDALAKGTEKEVLVVVTHDLTARAALCAMLHLADPSWDTFEEMSHCAWATLREGRRSWYISEYNILRLRPSDESNEFAEDDIKVF